jgi:sigma-E factor negative regulatory protein RseB
VIGGFPGWRVVWATVTLALLGTCAVALTLRHDAPGLSVADRPKPADPSRPRVTSARAVQRLLAEAAAAERDTEYSGEQVSDWWGPSGLSSSLMQVWHRPGRGTVAQAVVVPAGSSSVAGSGDPMVTMTMSDKQVKLLLANYQVEYAGPGSAGGRPAEVLAVRRPGGRLVARFWLDRQTKLPLRREIFDSAAQLISNISLIHLRVGAHAVARMPAPMARPWTRQLDARAVVGLRKRGWPVPVRIAGALRLFMANETSDSTGRVVNLSYSDGLSVISLFIQRGALPAVMPGWHRVAIGGHNEFTSDPDDRAVSWSSGGFVITMIADAPSATVDQAVASLAGNHGPGFWTRLGRGFGRLVRLANLFR